MLWKTSGICAKGQIWPVITVLGLKKIIIIIILCELHSRKPSENNIAHLRKQPNAPLQLVVNRNPNRRTVADVIPRYKEELLV